MKYIDELKMDGVPAITLYKNDGKNTEFKKKPSYQNFVQFLKDNGYKWVEWV